jgi:predicted O-methyltransferase YrrM
MLFPYLKYWLKAKSIQSVNDIDLKRFYHLVYSQLNTLDDSSIIALVKELKKDNSKIEITDFGAGSRFFKGNKRSVKSIAKSASTYGKYGKFLAQMVKGYQAKKVIELGTSLGIGASYMAMFNPNSTIYSIEGCDKISQKAKENIEKLKLVNVHLFTGEFNNTLDHVIALSSKPKLVYIDGDHTYKSTLGYYNYFKDLEAKNTILIFDDIYWSRGMHQAWLEIVKDKSSRLTLDFFRMGVVFLNQSLEKKHFVLKF